MIKDIVNGVLITSLIFLISVFIPIIGFAGALFIPVPILFYRLKLGRRLSAIIALLSAVIMIVFIGNLSLDVLFFAGLFLIGFVLGEVMELNLSIERTMLYTCGSVMISGLVGLFIFSLATGESIYTVVANYVAKNLQLTLVLYRDMGMSEENVHLIAQSLDKIQDALIRIIPSLVAVSTLFAAWTSILLAKPLLLRRSLFYPDFGPLNLWQAPEILVWGVIGCGAALFLPSTDIKIIALNGLLVLMTVYFFQGIAIVSYFFSKKGIPRIFRVFMYALIAIQQLILLAVIGLGFFDMWFNFRKLNTQDP